MRYGIRAGLVLAALAFAIAAILGGCGPTIAQTRDAHHAASASCISRQAAVIQQCSDEGASREACALRIENVRKACDQELETICRANLRARSVCRGAD